MDALKIKTAARKALIAADPHYHSWSAQHQERFRATMSEAAESRIEAVLLKEILKIQCAAENAGEIWRNLPFSKLDNLNWAKQLTAGIGNDMIYLNESMAESTSLLDFETLYDYDYDDYLFQEQTNKKQFKGYQAMEYYALRFPRWARLIIDDRFYYATLYSIASYLTEQLEDKGNDIIQTLIPHDYVEGKDHGKPEKSGSLWDMQVEANGLEKQLDELNNCWYQYTLQRWLELSRQFVQADPVVCMEDKNEDNELHRNFIFNNETALKQIRWQHFLADCNAIKAGYADVAELGQQELAKAENWLQATHLDIMQNFDPDVIKLKKKKKVVIAPETLDGLLEGDEGE